MGPFVGHVVWQWYRNALTFNASVLLHRGLRSHLCGYHRPPIAVLSERLCRKGELVFWLYVVAGIVICAALPALILAWGVWLIVSGRTGLLPGLTLGLLIAAWCTLVLLVIPYGGLYPNLPGVLIAGLLDAQAGGTVQTAICIATNSLMWPTVTTVLFLFIRRAGR